jgi:hypothetical protein
MSLKIIIILKNNYRYVYDKSLYLPFKEKGKRVVLANIRWAKFLNVAFLVVN